MQYKYQYIVDEQMINAEEFDDFFEAVAHMNHHSSENKSVKTAEILDMNKNTVVCARRIMP